MPNTPEAPQPPILGEPEGTGRDMALSASGSPSIGGWGASGATDTEPLAPPPPGVWKRLISNPLAAGSLIVLTFIVLCALFRASHRAAGVRRAGSETPPRAAVRVALIRDG
jgi:hypothetical protein